MSQVETHEYQFRAAINVRAYGTITVVAATMESAIAEIGNGEFMMSKHFSPHGGGDDDFDWNNSRPETYLENVAIDGADDEEILERDLPDPIPSSGNMSFRDALRAASELKAMECRVFRNGGPIFTVDELGQCRLENECLYLADMVDNYDWHCEASA
ncbi:hypothetical protein [Rhizobium nepotum]|uniref:hypothetical protein n=1 Tax=Rhizobium nepotum TaxID=1035271 RepID=UPI003CF320D1